MCIDPITRRLFLHYLARRHKTRAFPGAHLRHNATIARVNRRASLLAYVSSLTHDVEIFHPTLPTRYIKKNSSLYIAFLFLIFHQPLVQLVDKFRELLTNSVYVYMYISGRDVNFTCWAFTRHDPMPVVFVITGWEFFVNKFYRRATR